MPANNVSFFNLLNRDTQHQILVQATAKELFGRYRQINSKIKMEAELNLLAHSSIDSVPYQQKLLLHIAFNLHLYSNYPSFAKDRYLNALNKLLKFSTGLQPSMRLINLFIINTLSDKYYVLDEDFYAKVATYLEQVSYFNEGEIALCFCLYQNNPQRITQLWHFLINHYKNADDYFSHKAIFSTALELAPYINQADFIAFTNCVMEQKSYLTNKVKLVPYASDEQRTTLLTELMSELTPIYYARSMLDKCLATLMPFCTQAQQTTVLNRLCTIINDKASRWRKEAQKTLVVLFSTIPAARPTIFNLFINAINIDEPELQKNAIKCSAKLAPHYSPEQMNVLFDLLLLKTNDEEVSLRQTAIKNFKALIPHCNNAQRLALLSFLHTQLIDTEVLIEETALIVFLALVPHFDKTERYRLSGALLDKLDGNKWPRYFEANPKWILQNTTIFSFVSLATYCNNQAIEPLFNQLRGLLKHKDVNVRIASAVILRDLARHYNEEQRNLLLNDCNEALKDEDFRVNTEIMQVLTVLSPYLTPVQKGLLFENLIDKLNSYGQHHIPVSCISSCLITLIPDCIEAKKASLFSCLIDLSQNRMKRIEEEVVKMIAHSFLYYEANQQIMLFDLLMEKIDNDTISEMTIKSLSNIIPYCSKAQRIQLAAPLTKKLKTQNKDKFEPSISVLTELIHFLDEERQTSILTSIFKDVIVNNKFITSNKAYNSLVTLLPDMNDNQCLIMLDLFQNEFSAYPYSELVDTLSQLTLKFIHANRVALVDKILTMTETIKSTPHFINVLGLALINSQCNQYFLNRLQPHAMTI